MVDYIPYRIIFYDPEIDGNPNVYIGHLKFEIHARVVHHVIRTREKSCWNKG